MFFRPSIGSSPPVLFFFFEAPGVELSSIKEALTANVEAVHAQYMA